MASATRSGHRRRPSLAKARVALYDRLQARRAEIEQAILTRIHAIADPTEVADPTYVESLRAALRVALDYGLVTIERGEERAPPVPAVLLTQARMASQNAVSLDTVLRRYFAGYTLLNDFLMQEAECTPLGAAPLQSVMREQVTLFDRLVAAVTEEYGREEQSRLGSSEQRRTKCVMRLLAGEPIDTAALAYDFDARHTGVVAAGPRIGERLRALATVLDQRLLLVRRAEGIVWAWLGSRRGLDSVTFEQALPERSAQVTVALGEPGEGLSGWRLSHRQALAAMPIARRGCKPLVRYSEVALLASMLRDDLLTASLPELYLAPLEDGRDGGEIARQTLRAYFAAGRNAASAAAVLGVTRQTVNNRLRAIEDQLGRPLDGCAQELVAALRLEEFGRANTAAIPD